MGAWVLKDATSSWETVFDRAWAGEPQFVSRDGAQTVVVISLRSYEAAKPKKATLFETLRSCLFGSIDLSCERNHEEMGRPAGVPLLNLKKAVAPRLTQTCRSVSVSQSHFRRRIRPAGA